MVIFSFKTRPDAGDRVTRVEGVRGNKERRATDQAGHCRLLKDFYFSLL